MGIRENQSNKETNNQADNQINTQTNTTLSLVIFVVTCVVYQPPLVPFIRALVIPASSKTLEIVLSSISYIPLSIAQLKTDYAAEPETRPWKPPETSAASSGASAGILPWLEDTRTNSSGCGHVRLGGRTTVIGSIQIWVEIPTYWRVRQVVGIVASRSLVVLPPHLVLAWTKP
jgi:hypothetical protein